MDVSIRPASLRPKSSIDHHMKFSVKTILLLTGTALLFSVSTVRAADANEEIIEGIMKKYHKAPRGTDNIAQKFQKGTATPEEVKDLVAAYDKLAKTKPPKGDEKSWKEKTTKLAEAAHALQKGDANGAAMFKEAVNCKACHMAHKPD
jgi:hypothetical protein